VELGLPLLDPERGLLGPGLELRTDPPEVFLGIAIGVEGIDLIDRLVDVSIEILNILFRRAGKTSLVEIEFETEDLFIGGSVFLARRLLRRLVPIGLTLRTFVALSPPMASGRDEHEDEKQQSDARSDRRNDQEDAPDAADLIPRNGERPSEGQRKQDEQDRPWPPSMTPNVSQHRFPPIVGFDAEYRREDGPRVSALRTIYPS
jgi:hypothetical protein